MSQKLKEIILRDPIRDTRELWNEIVSKLGSSRQWIQSKGVVEQPYRNNLIICRYAKLKVDSKLKMEGKSKRQIKEDLAEENDLCYERICQIISQAKKEARKQARDNHRKAIT